MALLLSGDYMVLAYATVACLLLYQFVVFPVFKSPLAKVPNAHPTVPISSLWILWKRFSNEDATSVDAAHEAKGPVVRLGPNEISINCVKDGVRIVYAPGFEKSPWYSVMENYGMKNMVSMLEHKSHAVRKRMLSHVYSKSFLLSSAPLWSTTTRILQTRFLPYLSSCASSKTDVEVMVVFSAVAIDINTAYLFGMKAAPSFSQDLDQCRQFLTWYHAREPWMIWKQEFPVLARHLIKLRRALGLRRDAPRRQLESTILQWCDRAAHIYSTTPDPSLKTAIHNANAALGNADDYPRVYAQLRSSMEHADSKLTTPAAPNKLRLEVAAEPLDLLSAGFETSNMTMKDIVRRLSWNPAVQAALRAELRSTEYPFRIAPIEASMIPPDPKAIDSLPLLSGVIYETLRLHPPAPNGLPRIVPPRGCTLGGYPNIPANVRVSAQAYSLHRNPEVFPDPETWRPDRWLDSNGKFISGGEMHRWWWAFGSGGRMCIGSQFAIYQRKYMIAVVYSNFATRVAEKETDMVGRNLVLSEASKSQLMVRLETVAW